HRARAHRTGATPAGRSRTTTAATEARGARGSQQGRDDEVRPPGAARRRRRVQVNVDSRHGFELPTAPIKREVMLPETITVGELAQRMAVKANEVIKAMMKMGVMATINQPIDQDTAQLVVE